VAAPGVDILSTWLSGGYASLGGASMATPHAAGAAILYLQDHLTASPADVETAIVGDLDVDAWTTDNTPNAAGRLNVEGL
jgi:subtilisin family serine protease